MRFSQLSIGRIVCQILGEFFQIDGEKKGRRAQDAEILSTLDVASESAGFLLFYAAGGRL